MADTEPNSSNGKSWQSYVELLVTVHFRTQGEEYQPIPDRTHGDNGLEGFSTCGCGIQAFCDESRNANERTKAQKKKVRDDLKKLVEYEKYWTETLAELQLRRWYLVAPYIDNKAVVTYARKQARSLRQKGLPFIASNFEAFVVTTEQFAEAKARLDSQGVSHLAVLPAEVDVQALSRLVSEQPTFIANLDRKLNRIYSPASVEASRQLLLQKYLKSKNLEQQVEEQSPTFWEELASFLAAKAESIVLETELDDRAPKRRLSEVRREVMAELERRGKLPRHAIETLSWGTVTSWMGDCPLRFPEEQNA